MLVPVSPHGRPVLNITIPWEAAPYTEEVLVKLPCRTTMVLHSLSSIPTLEAVLSPLVKNSTSTSHPMLQLDPPCLVGFGITLLAIVRSTWTVLP